MIDNPKQVEALMAKMELHFPIPVKATAQLMAKLRASGTRITSTTPTQIIKAMSSGDAGGIVCELKILGESSVVVIVSLTHLRVANTHPIARDIKAYQTARTAKLH